ncbi:MAG: hypothetical protein JXB62_09820 [Pirellulales bacterium]|nr:hypothetical protein [Pirellulales bacterium]
MYYLIGTDEAGFGPNLGPLVISVTVWQVADGSAAEDLYQRLDQAISRTPQRQRRGPEGPGLRVAMADSKSLYKPGHRLHHLERGLWAAWAWLGLRPETWSQVWQALAPEAAADRPTIPWYANYDETVPLDVDADELPRLGVALRQTADAAGVRLVQLASRVLFPERFNELLEQHGSKGAMLSHSTLALISRAAEPLADVPIFVVCDKHGGRNRYASLLAEHFPDRLIEVYGESRQQSVYRFGPPQRRMEFRFQMQAESWLPVALASMASKYLRELAMRALNDFWCRRVEGLRPTAGYPQDAKRFRAAIAQRQAELQIEDRVLWRRK